MIFRAKLIIAALLYASSVNAQIPLAAVSDGLRKYVDETNVCLARFDASARTKKLGADTYKLALDGACTQDIRDLRSFFALELTRSESREYLLQRYDNVVKDTKAKMVADYIMR